VVIEDGACKDDQKEEAANQDTSGLDYRRRGGQSRPTARCGTRRARTAGGKVSILRWPGQRIVRGPCYCEAGFRGSCWLDNPGCSVCLDSADVSRTSSRTWQSVPWIFTKTGVGSSVATSGR